MLISMTGFGEAHRQVNGLAISVELRTINSRHFKLSYRASEGYAVLEPNIEALLRKSIRRGTVQLALRVDRESSADNYRINGAVLESYRTQLAALAQQLGTAEPNSLESFLLLPGVVQEQRRSEFEPTGDWEIIESLIRQAIEAVEKMRAEEGQAMADDLRFNCRHIGEQLDAIAERAPTVVERYRVRLAERVNQALSDLKVTVQPADLLREVSLFTDRSDISEEIVRLRSHLQQFEDALNLRDCSGRKLEFIAQEIGREVNTIGSKANDAEISHHVVEIKSALERIREQVQNVE